ncbi:MAG: hypothetical protein FWH07_01395 [Oscillospiraceae bacterium]|nr:hypothetical protein [Oscillospiraceae bacterium]
MEVNNNNEINRMFGTEDSPIMPPREPALQTSPLGAESTPGASPFQTDADNNSRIPSNIDFSDGARETSSRDAIIGDHSGFGFAKHYSPRGRLRLTLILLPIFLLIGAVGGAFAARAYFFGYDISAEQSAAQTAIDAVYDYAKIGSVKKVIFADVFVNNKTNEYECVLFTVIEDSAAEFRTAAFRVLIEKGGGAEDVDVFAEFEQDEYDRLINSGNDRDNIQAQLLLNQKHEFERCLSEILAGKWVNVEPSYINARIINRGR